MPRRKKGLTMDERAAQPLEIDNPDVEYLRLSRQQICMREINSAVRLFIFDEDLISAYLLASAAIGIMEPLSKGHSAVGLNNVREALKQSGASKELTDELFQSLAQPYNFLKHGSSDFSVENAFPVEQMVMTIYTAINSYKELFKVKLTLEMLVFFGHVQSWCVRWWSDTPDYDERLARAKKIGLIGASRQQFCEFSRQKIQQLGETDRQF